MMQFRKLLNALVIGGVLFSSLISAQVRFIPLNVDYACFQTPRQTAFLEIYVSFPQRALEYVREGQDWNAKFLIKLQIFNEDSLVFERSQPFNNRLETLDNINRFSELRHVFSCEVIPGSYQARIFFTDEVARRTGQYELPVAIRDYVEEEMTLSDIQLAAKVAKADGESYFDKNGLQVIPNPSGIYHVGMPILYYYAEVHNMPYDPANPGDFTLETYVTNLQGDTVRQFPAKQKQKPGESAVLVGGNNIITLASAPHLLHLKLTDNSSGRFVERSKRFTMFKPTVEQVDEARAMTTRLMQSYYEKFSEESLDEEFQKVFYIAHDDERRLFKTLSGIQPKAEFLTEFWRVRDPDPTTPHNEFKLEYFQKLEIADQNFKTKFKPGWRSDRGRVFLTYGEPDEIERSPVQSATRPYEIWSYQRLENGSIFVFADLQGFGDYELLHSTYRKEIYQPDWERRIRLIRDNSTLDIVPDNFLR